MRKKINYSSIIFLLFIGKVWACDVCQAQQPKILRNITHGQGPQGTMDYIIIGIAALIVLFTLILSIKYLIKPGEKNPDHIKNIVVNQNSEI